MGLVWNVLASANESRTPYTTALARASENTSVTERITRLRVSHLGKTLYRDRRFRRDADLLMVAMDVVFS